MNSDNSMIDPNSFRSVDLLGNSKELEEVLKGLNQDGSHLWKVRSASKWFKRKFVLDLNSMCMKYEPSSKSPCFSKAKQHSKKSLFILSPDLRHTHKCTHVLYSFTYCVLVPYIYV